MKRMICNRCGERFKKTNGCKLNLSVSGSVFEPELKAHLCRSCYRDMINAYIDQQE